MPTNAARARASARRSTCRCRRARTIDAFRAAQATALDAIGAFAPGLLIVSFGADTWEGDPIAPFALTPRDYPVLARDIAARGWPTAILMEGGYAVDALGDNVASVPWRLLTATPPGRPPIDG